MVISARTSSKFLFWLPFTKQMVINGGPPVLYRDNIMLRVLYLCIIKPSTKFWIPEPSQLMAVLDPKMSPWLQQNLVALDTTANYCQSFWGGEGGLSWKRLCFNYQVPVQLKLEFWLKQGRLSFLSSLQLWLLSSLAEIQERGLQQIKGSGSFLNHLY